DALSGLKGDGGRCSTSAGDFFSRPLVGGPVAVVAPPHALAATVTSAAIAVAALRARTRRMRFSKIIPLAAVPRSRREAWLQVVLRRCVVRVEIPPSRPRRGA